MGLKKEDFLICVGWELVKKCSDHGLEGIIAHELAHIKHRHCVKLTAMILSGAVLGSYLFKYNFREALKNGLKFFVFRQVSAFIIEKITRRCEEQADSTAITAFEEAGNFVDGMEEFEGHVRGDFETYKKEYALVDEKKLNKFTRWRFRLYDELMRIVYKQMLDGKGSSHPSFKQRIDKGKLAILKLAAKAN